MQGSDYKLALETIVNNCAMVRPLADALKGNCDDGEFTYKTLWEQMHFVEKYVKQQFRSSGEPFDWINNGNWHSPELNGLGVKVYVAPLKSLVVSREHSKDQSVKSKSQKVQKDHPGCEAAFANWFNVLKKIGHGGAESSNILGLIGLMIELHQIYRCDDLARKFITDNELRQVANDSRVQVDGVGEMSLAEKCIGVEVFFKKCCSCIIAKPGEAAISLKSFLKHTNLPPRRELPRQRTTPVPPSPKPIRQPPRYEAPRQRLPPRPEPRWTRENPAKRGGGIIGSLFGGMKRLIPPKRVIVAASGAVLAVILVIQMRDSKTHPKSVRGSEVRSNDPAPTSIDVRGEESKGGGFSYEEPTPSQGSTVEKTWRHSKEWYLDQVKTIAAELNRRKNGNYEYSQSQLNSVVSAVSRLGNLIKNDDLSGCETAYQDVRRLYDAFIASCTLKQIRPPSPSWTHPKEWYLNECDVMAKNVAYFTSGGYRYDRNGPRLIDTKIRAVRNFVNRNDPVGTEQSYVDLKTEYQGFANGCQWQPNLRHPRYQHVISAQVKNQWTTESGWEFVNPGTTDFSVRRKTIQVACRACGGSRYRQQAVTCSNCNGRGKIANPAAQAVDVAGGVVDVLNAFGGRKNKRKLPRMPRVSQTITCPGCNGKGRQYQQIPCNNCNGTGVTYQNAR